MQPGNIKWKYILHEAGVSKQILLWVLLAAATLAAGRDGSWSSLLVSAVARAPDSDGGCQHFVPALRLCPSHLQLPSPSSTLSQH